MPLGKLRHKKGAQGSFMRNYTAINISSNAATSAYLHNANYLFCAK